MNISYYNNSLILLIAILMQLQFARGDFVELLISSNIARYSEFCSVSRILTCIDGHKEVVPCSRSDVFASAKVSVIEKRMLMRILKDCMEIDEENVLSTLSVLIVWISYILNCIYRIW